MLQMKDLKVDIQEMAMRICILPVSVSIFIVILITLI